MIDLNAIRFSFIKGHSHLNLHHTVHLTFPYIFSTNFVEILLSIEEVVVVTSDIIPVFMVFVPEKQKKYIVKYKNIIDFHLIT